MSSIGTTLTPDSLAKDISALLNLEWPAPMNATTVYVSVAMACRSGEAEHLPITQGVDGPWSVPFIRHKGDSECGLYRYGCNIGTPQPVAGGKRTLFGQGPTGAIHFDRFLTVTGSRCVRSIHMRPHSTIAFMNASAESA